MRMVMSGLDIGKVLLRLSVCGLGLLVCACSSGRQVSVPEARLHHAAAKVGAGVPAPIPAHLGGRYRQQPVTGRSQHVVDDPTEPFSPNYGSVDPGVAALARNAEPWIIPGAEGFESTPDDVNAVQD